jgi:hypothetical protein
MPRVRFANSNTKRNLDKANTGTKKKGINNKAKNIIASNKSKKQDKLYKLQKHIDYCKNLEKAYNQKHEEVRALTDYLKELASKTPEKPISETDLIKIIDNIGEIPDPGNVDEKQTKLDALIKKQQEWKKEIRETIKPTIDTKLTQLKGTRKEVVKRNKLQFKLGKT